jgi:hypothetical protein
MLVFSVLRSLASIVALRAAAELALALARALVLA